MLTFMSWLVSSSMAGSPSAVAGTLIITFGRATSFHRRRASATVPRRVAREVGRDLEAHEPSSPLVASNTGLNRSAAARMSSIASVS